MANYKSWVFCNTNDSQPLVTPTGARFHVYVSPIGQLQVINNLGEIVPQNFTGGSSGGGQTTVLSGTNISIGGSASSPTVSVVDNPTFGGEVNFYGGARFSLAGPIIFEDGLQSLARIDVLSISGLTSIAWAPQSQLPQAEEGQMFYSAGTGLYICTGATASTWRRVVLG